MPLVGGADPNGTAPGDPTDLRFDRPYMASPTGLVDYANVSVRAAIQNVCHITYMVSCWKLAFTG
eukprot:6199912-Pleurochrysis_carterae.AAC.3